MLKPNQQTILFAAAISLSIFTSCNNEAETKTEQPDSTTTEKKKEPVSQPLVSHIYTADPSAHVFNGRIYIYPSHDTATGTKEDDLGGHFDMRDYHILSMDSVGGTVTDHGMRWTSKMFPGPAGKCGRPMPHLPMENIICISR